MKCNRVQFQRASVCPPFCGSTVPTPVRAAPRRGSLAAEFPLPRLRQLPPSPLADPSPVAVPSLPTAGVRHVTAGTIFASSELPLTVWFLAIHLLT